MSSFVASVISRASNNICKNDTYFTLSCRECLGEILAIASRFVLVVLLRLHFLCVRSTHKVHLGKNVVGWQEEDSGYYIK